VRSAPLTPTVTMSRSDDIWCLTTTVYSISVELVQENVQDAAKKCPPPKKIAICKNSVDVLLHNFVLDFNKCMKIVKNTDDISPCY